MYIDVVNVEEKELYQWKCKQDQQMSLIQYLLDVLNVEIVGEFKMNLVIMIIKKIIIIFYYIIISKKNINYYILFNNFILFLFILQLIIN